MLRAPLLCAALLCGVPHVHAQEADAAFRPELFEALEWREVGPYRGGRSAACTGVPGQRDVYYFGAAGGGVWKTENGGEDWANVSDGYFGGSIGAVAVSEWDPNVIYVGGGEKTVRGNVSHGEGVWKSTDAGRTWTFSGLPDSRRISRLRIHPRDPDVVYAAVMGHLFGPNEERGVFRSRDGGESWERVLFVNPDAGCVDLAMDPTNPRVLYACFWRVLRTPWSLESGGEGSTMWKSTDGGSTWTELTRNPGLPAGTRGISGICVSPTDPDNVYAIIEAEQGGVFRSRDGGATWRRTNSERKLRQRAWYYSRICADPADAEACYVLNVRFHRSVDGGRTFQAISTPHSDNHDLWIDPQDPLRMIEANDGGANVSYDGGETWSTQENQPTAQMYRVSVDEDFPYRLLGGQQDNSALRIRSRSFTGGAITRRDWDPTAGGESGHVVAKPDDPDVVLGGSYGGTLGMVNHRTGEVRAVDVWPDNPMGWGAGDLRYRFQWNFPLFFSPHDPDVLYAAANVLFRSTDLGASWEAISPDLTRNDPSKMGPSGGPITKDNTSVEYYGTIFAAVESPLVPGLLWCGSDDGRLHVSRDAGATWTNVTPEDLPGWTQINSIDAHPTEPGGLYVAGTRYKLDDFEPYLFRTLDYGRTWTRIDTGIARDHFTRVVRADPERPGLLYAGTERGVYVSFDDGATWTSLQTNLPVVPVTDLAVKSGDLVAATQGRGYWILDDLSVLRQVDLATHQGATVLYTPRPTYRLRSGWGRARHAGANPPTGVVFWYLIGGLDPDDEVELSILDPEGTPIHTFEARPAPDADRAPWPAWKGTDPRQLPTEIGLNRFVWDLRHPSAESFENLILWNGNLSGPRALPGTYTARFSVGGRTGEVPFEILPDPRSSATPEDLRAQFDLAKAVRDKLTETHRAIRRLREAKTQLRDLIERAGDAQEVRDRAEELVSSLTEVEQALYQTKNQSRQDPLNFPIRLNDKLAGLGGLVRRGDFAPTGQMRRVWGELSAAVDEQLSRVEGLLTEGVEGVNRVAGEAAIPAVLIGD